MKDSIEHEMSDGFKVAITFFVLSIPVWIFFNFSVALFTFGMAIGGLVTSFMPDKESKELDDEVHIQRDRKQARKVGVGKKKLQAITERIELAIETGEIITIKYMGGSNPGEVRDIFPLAFDDKVTISAICQKDKQKKTFRIDRMIFEDMENDVA